MKAVTVTSPLLPPLEEYVPYLQDIWNRKWLTNNGFYHQKLEKELASFLKVPYISLFSNGTLALVAALSVLEVKGEVVTTPYSFVASAHALRWNNLQPVFADVEPRTLNLDPQEIEAALTPQTTAIMPVHVYGTPCDVERIESIAERHGLKTIYDAAHAFAVERHGESILNHGDAAVLSFHATKSFSTIEGGAVVSRTQETKSRLDRFRNFGFEDELTVNEYGLNAKLNEFQAAYGLLCLKHFRAGVLARKKISDFYRRRLRLVAGISVLEDLDGVGSNYSYFPIFVNKEEYGRSRDELYQALRQRGIMSRRYFYPLISDFAVYKGLPSASKKRLPVASAAAERVICLPIHADLREEDAQRVVDIIRGSEKTA